MKKYNLIAFMLFVIVLSGLFIMMSQYSPSNVGPFGILLFFILMYLTCNLIASYLIVVLNRMYIFLSLVVFKKKLPEIKSKSVYYYSTLISTIPVFIIAFKSVGDVGLFEVGLITIFEVLGLFYIRKKLIT